MASGAARCGASSQRRSSPRRARQAGSVIAERLRLPLVTADGLHEHDRRAIRFLGADEFAARMRDLFAHPDATVFGSESASAALARFTAAVDRVTGEQSGDIVI